MARSRYQTPRARTNRPSSGKTAEAMSTHIQASTTFKTSFTRRSSGPWSRVAAWAVIGVTHCSIWPINSFARR